MICRRCLQRASTAIARSEPSYSLSTPQAARLRTSRLPSRNSSRPFTQTTRYGAAAAAAAPSTADPAASSTPPPSSGAKAGESSSSTPKSSCPEGTVMEGLNYFKNKTDPVALADDAYPEWLWRCLDVQKKADDGSADDAGDEFCECFPLLPFCSFWLSPPSPPPSLFPQNEKEEEEERIHADHARTHPQPSPRSSASSRRSGSGRWRRGCWRRATCRRWRPRSRCSGRASTCRPTRTGPRRAPSRPPTPARSSAAPCAASARPRSRRPTTSRACERCPALPFEPGWLAAPSGSGSGSGSAICSMYDVYIGEEQEGKKTKGTHDRSYSLTSTLHHVHTGRCSKAGCDLHDDVKATETCVDR